MTEYILWGVKNGDPEWHEQIITQAKSKEHLAKAQKWAEENDFSKFRVLTFNGEKPDFVGTLNL